MVTSTSTPASMLMMICLTTSVGAFRSIRRLWILDSVHQYAVLTRNHRLRGMCFIYIPHLEQIPGLGALTTGCLAGGDLEVLGRQADGALDAQLLALGALDELAADLLQRSDLLAGEGDADLVDLGCVELRALLCVLERHFGGV